MKDYVDNALKNFSHKDSVVLLCYGGSHAYGTNVEGSDVDLRGVCLNTAEEYRLMNTNQTAFVSNETDTTVYFLKNFMELASNCNPNVIELLGCKPEHYFVLDDAGKMLVDNVELFLSKRAVNTFGGYATQQLRRLQNALVHDTYPQSEKEEHIKKSLQSSFGHLTQHYQNFSNGGFNVYTAPSTREDFEKELFIDADLRKYPLREFSAVLSEMNNTVRNYDKLNNRNKKKDQLHLDKHAMHLMRLFFMVFDVLDKKEVNTYREKEHDFLMSVRNGEVPYEEIFRRVDEYEARMHKLAETSTLPERPNQEKLNQLMLKLSQFVV